MKVAHLMGTLNRGGAETLLLDICNNAKAAGLDMALVHRKEGTMLNDFQNSGVELVKLSPKSFWDIGYLFKLRRLIKGRQFDLLHAHQNIDALIALIASIGLGTKVVLSVHSHGLEKSLIHRTIRLMAMSNVDLLLYVSKSQKNHYGRKNKGVVIHNGIDFTKNGNSEPIDIRTDFKVSEDEILLGSVGNFTSVRDQITVCKFLALIYSKGINFKFIFIGAPSSAEPELFTSCVDFFLEHGITGRVIFAGSRSDVPSLLPQLDAFIYSTIHDTFGIALVEAIASGIPVFVNDQAVMKEVTNNGAWANIYQTKNMDDLCSKFIQFYNEPDLYLEKARENAIAIKIRYDIGHYLKKLKDIYTSLLIDKEP
jgi:glycosyltransferase involved in cell wall biosynthesis